MRPAPLAVFAVVLSTGCGERPFEKAQALEARGQLREAAAAYRDLAKLDPANLGAWDRAIDLFCRKVSDVGECLGVLDLELDRLGRIDRHSEVLGEVLETRARARLEQGLIDAALDDLRRAERVAPGRASLYVAEARAHLARSAFPEAIAAIDRARTLDPQNQEADAVVASLPSRRALWRPMRSAALALLVLGSACVELSAPPCTSSGRCLAGFECVAGQCLECVPGGCGGYRVLAVGPGGGMVCSDDQACVTIPAGALFDGAAIWARRAAVQSTVSVEARSAIYEFGPSDAVFSMNVQIALPISPTASTAEVRVYRLNGEGATPLEGSTEETKASGASIGLGLFVAGRAP